MTSASHSITFQYARHLERMMNFSTRIIRRAILLKVLILLVLISPFVRATDYSSILISNPYYYVPSNLTLAYRTMVSNAPVPVGDQTLWDINSAYYTNNNGTNETIFTGTAIAYIGSTNGSTSSISGTISSSGQVSMNFVANGNTNVGVGQMASYNGATNFLMQTMDGSPISYDTHWAYMSPTNTLTNLTAASSTTPPTYSTATQWTQYLSLLGSVWSYSSASLGGSGTFTVSTYTNGYFSGSGVTSGSSNFTFLDSVTPNGTVLFNYSVPGNPYVGSLWGQLSGSNVGATISLATYDSSASPNYDGAGTMTTAGLVVGFDTNGQTPTFSNGLSTNFGGTYVGYTTNGNANGLTITSNSVVSNAYNVTIGYEGSGNSLTITNGGKLYDRDGYVTAVAGSNNSVVIAGEGSVWSNSGSLYVAASPDNAGTGTVTLLSGGTLAASNLIISGVTNSVGTVEVGLKGGMDSNMTLNVQTITFGEGTGSLGLNQSDTLTISGHILGATATNSYAMIQQYGSGTTILTGESHTGTGYRVDGGQLRVDGGIFDIVLSAGASPGELGGPRTLCVGNKYSGKSLVITNGGFVHSFLTIFGTGTQKDTEVLTGTSNNWALVTGMGSQLDAGELLIGNVSSGNSLMISNGATVTCSLFTSIGASGSSNSVIVNGAGSLISNAGSLELGSYSESNVSSGNSILITNGGGLFSGSATIASSTNSFGNSVIVTGSGSFWTNSGNLILGDAGSGNSLIIANGGTLFSSNSYISYTPGSSNNSVIVSGSGSVWNNTGVLVIGNASSGSLTVMDGGIVSAAKGINIGASGILQGNGTVVGNLTNGGMVAPGTSPGTLTVNGNFNQTSGGTLLIQIDNGLSDMLVVSGTATLGGALIINSYGGHQFQYGEKIVFLTASNISGTFSSIIAPAGERARLVIEGDPTASVIIAPQSYTQLAQGRNQVNVATALNSFIPATSGDQLVISTTLDSLAASEYNQAFNAIMPTFYQQVATIAFNQANAQNMELNQRLWGVRVAEGGGFSMSGLADNYAMLQEGIGDGLGKGVLDSKKDILRPGLDNHWGMFVDGNGIFAQANSANMLPGYNSESGGVTTGLTYKWNKNVASGIYAGYQGTYTKSGSNGSGLGTGSSLTDNAVRFGVFGTYGQEDGKGFYANALAGGAYHNLQATRVIQYTGVNRTANSSPGAGELDTMLATGYDVQKGKFTFGPTASLQYTYLGVNSVNETGAQSLNFNSGGWNSSSMLSSLGAHAAYTWQASRNILVVPQISLNWQHEFMQNPYAINGSLGGTRPTFSNWSASGIRDYLYTGVGFTVEFAKNWTTSFFYNASAGNSDLVSQNIFWSAGVKF